MSRDITFRFARDVPVLDQLSTLLKESDQELSGYVGRAILDENSGFHEIDALSGQEVTLPKWMTVVEQPGGVPQLEINRDIVAFNLQHQTITALPTSAVLARRFSALAVSATVNGRGTPSAVCREAMAAVQAKVKKLGVPVVDDLALAPPGQAISFAAVDDHLVVNARYPLGPFGSELRFAVYQAVKHALKMEVNICDGPWPRRTVAPEDTAAEIARLRGALGDLVATGKHPRPKEWLSHCPQSAFRTDWLAELQERDRDALPEMLTAGSFPGLYTTRESDQPWRRDQAPIRFQIRDGFRFTYFSRWQPLWKLYWEWMAATGAENPNPSNNWFDRLSDHRGATLRAKEEQLQNAHCPAHQAFLDDLRIAGVYAGFPVILNPNAIAQMEVPSS